MVDESATPPEDAQPDAVPAAAEPEVGAAEPGEGEGVPLAGEADAGGAGEAGEADAAPPPSEPELAPEAAAEPEQDEEEYVEAPAPREKPAVPGADLEVDIVPEGVDPLAATTIDPYAEYELEEAPVEEELEDVVVAAPIEAVAIDLAAGARYRATGKRKSAIARVTLRPGSGSYTINGRALPEYFPRETLQRNIRQPLETVGYEQRMDVIARMHGGGVSAQAGALRHGISRALLEADPNLRGELKRRGFLTRDARAKERKKAGLKAAASGRSSRSAGWLRLEAGAAGARSADGVMGRRLFGTDGVRGLAGVDLTAQLALALGRAAVLHGEQRAPRALVIRDTRESGEMLEAALAAGIASAGGEVALGGVLPTPAAPLLVRRHLFDLGVVISASPNPYTDNGIKFFGAGGFKLTDETEREIELHRCGRRRWGRADRTDPRDARHRRGLPERARASLRGAFPRRPRRGARLRQWGHVPRSPESSPASARG